MLRRGIVLAIALGLVGGAVHLTATSPSEALFIRSWKRSIRRAVSRVKRMVRRVVTRTRSGVRRVVTRARSGVRRAFSAVRRRVRSAFSRARLGVSRAVSAVRHGVRRVGAAIKTGIKKAISAVETVVNRALVPIKSFGQTVSKALKGVAAAIQKQGLATIVETLRALKWCRFKSFRRAVGRPASGPFTMIFGSDTQFPWWGTNLSPCANEDCVVRNSVAANRNQIRAMEGVQRLGSWPAALGGGRIGKPQGVVLNGDLTAYAHTWQWYLFDQHFNTKVGKSNVLRLPVYPGLGNHDYANNVPPDGSCYGTVPQYLPYGKWACGRFSEDYIRRMMSCGGVGGFDAGKVRSFDNKSLAYSWEIGDYHFVQLHLRPNYEITNKNARVEKSIAWLTEDVADADRRGKKIVLNFHDPTGARDPGFLAAIRGKRVVALFAGHFHETWGQDGTIPGTRIPIFLSGSSDQRKFLLAEFGPRHLRVSVVDSSGGRPAFQAPTGRNRVTNTRIDF